MNCRNQYLSMEKHSGHLTLSPMCLKGPVLAPSSSFCMLVSYSLSWKVHAYADDTQLYIAFKPEPEHAANAVTAMQACITDIRRWMLMDKQMLNDEKTEFIVIKTGQQLVKVSIDSLCVGHTAILSSSEMRNLGAGLTTNLRWSRKETKHVKPLSSTYSILEGSGNFSVLTLSKLY